MENGWITRNNTSVTNKDFWEELLRELRHYEQSGMSVEVWRIPRNLNQVADQAAKNAASEVSISEWS